MKGVRIMKIRALVLGAIMSVCAASTAFAAAPFVSGGQWKQGIIRPDTWWYENADGTWLADTWAWIDGNKDGIFECYYFDQEGWMIYNAESPDHWVTNADGCWTLAGVVQTKTAQ